MPPKPKAKRMRAKVEKAFNTLPDNHSHSLRTFCVWLVESGVFPDHKPHSLHRHCAGLFDGTRKMTFTDEEKQLIIERRNHYNALEDECEREGVDPKDVKHYWYKSKHFSMFVKNNDFDLEEWRERLINDMATHAPEYPEINRKKCKDPHLLMIDPADVHIGKLARAIETGEEYNSQIAVQRVHEAVEGIMQKVSGYQIEKILFVGGNDILHTDNTQRKSTKGTPQDTDGMWYDNFLDAKRLYVEVLEKLMSVADVHFMYNPSNHDLMTGFLLSDTIVSWFRNCEHISFDCSMAHRKYMRWNNTLIGTTHGDGAKATDLPLLMAHESEHWSSTKHRYIFGHHVHHKVAKDFIGVTYETLRSPSGSDSWHSKMGYKGAPLAIEGYLFHREHGQIARLTHLF